MLYLFTGLMGSSKTLNAIKFLCEDKAFKDRPVYYYRVRDLSPDLGWTEINDEQLKNWRDFPDGSVFFVDECDHAFPTRTKDAVPEYIREIKETRRRGMDFVFVTQDASQMDVFVRRNINFYVHLERPFQAKAVRWLQWDKFVNPNDRRERSKAIKRRVTLDKKYFGFYKSAEQHTHVTRWPWRTFAFLALGFLVVIALGWKLKSSWSSPDVPQQASSSAPERSSSFNPISSITDRSRLRDKEINYNIDFEPRIPDVPFTAPIYDEVVEIKSFPRPQCYVWESGIRKGQCRCVSQQATPLHISKEACLGYVRAGYFQPYLADRALESANSDPSVPRRGHSGDSRGYDSAQSESPVRYINNVSNPRMVSSSPRAYTTGVVQRERF